MWEFKDLLWLRTYNYIITENNLLPKTIKNCKKIANITLNIIENVIPAKFVSL